jgi:hypothetical protein
MKSINRKVIPGLAARNIQNQMDYDKKKEYKNIVSEDSIARKNIHIEIKRLLEYGLDKKETLERLSEKFPESKYNIYFQNWIEDCYKKILKERDKDKGEKKDGQDR